MANRYSQITTSKFNPLSFEQIAAPAMMKREQHNKALADQELMVQGLAKVRPHEKFYSEAQRLKAEIQDKVNIFGENLAKEGVNSNTQAGMIALNRQFQESISATGKLGMIDEHNVNLQKTYQESIKNSMALGNSEIKAKEHADAAVKEHLASPLYNEKTGQVVAFQGPSAPKHIDHIARATEIFKNAGLTSKEIDNLASSIVPSADGSSYVLTQGAKSSSSNNFANLQSAVNFLNAEINTPSSETAQSLKYNGISSTEALNDIKNLSPVFKRSGYASGTTSTINDRQGPPKVEENEKNSDGRTAAISENVQLNENIGNAIESIDKYSKSAKVTPITGRNTTHMTPDDIKKYNSTHTLSPATRFKNNLTPAQQEMYVKTFNAKRAQGKIPKGADIYSEVAINAVKKDWVTRKNFNYTNSILIPGSTGSNILASPSLVGKQASELDGFARKRFDVAIRTKQQLFFDDEGQAVDMEDVDRSSISLTGHYSALNILKPFGGNSKNTISPHVVSYTDKKGKVKSALMARDANEMEGNSLFRAASVIHQTGQDAVENMNNFTTFTTKTMPELVNNEKGINSLRVKYSSDQSTFTLEAFKNGKLVEKTKPMSSEEYQNTIYNFIN